MESNDGQRPIFERRLTRRSLVGGGLGLVAGSAFLTACGGGGGTEQAAPPPPPTAEPPSGTTEAPPATTTSPAAGTPVKGGTLVFGMESAASGFDPVHWWNGPGFIGGLAMFDRLVKINDDGSLEPELLQAMPEANADGTLYTFALKQGVMFHHGRELTADDVKFSLERLVMPATGSEGGGLYTGLTIPGMQDVLNEKDKTLSGITVVDDYTLSIALEQPDSVFLYLLGLPFASVVPRDVVEEMGDKKFNLAPVGSGPYKATEVAPDKHVRLERHTDYWNPDLPYADTVEWNIGIGPDLSVLRIQDGEQDLMYEPIPSGAFDQVSNNPDLENQVVIGTANNVGYVTLSLKHEALKDLKVRQAIAMALDKDRLVRTLKGLAQVADGGLFSPLSPYYQAGLAYPFDPEGAKALLAQTQFADGFDVEFWGRNFTPWLEIGQTLQQDLKGLGINVKLNQLNNEAVLAVVVTNPPGITENEWELPYPHGSYVMDGAFTKGALDSGCCNFSNFVSPDFDKLAQQAHRETDPAKITELYKEMDRIAIKDDALWVPLFYPKRADLVSARLKGYTGIPTSPGPAIKRLASYWLET